MSLLWLRAAHFVGLFLWAGGLLALTRLLASRAALAPEGEGGAVVARVARNLYRGVVAPGAFLVFLSGIWMLHQNAALLKQPFMHAKLMAVLALFVVDHLCLRSIKRLMSRRASLYLALHGLTVFLVIAAVLLVELRPWIRS